MNETRAEGKHTPTRAEALKELKECYALLAGCQERFTAETPPGRYQPPPFIVDEIMSDCDAYMERIKQLERLLASEMTA